MAYPNLRFENPLFLTFMPGGPDRVFVVEQDGRVRWFENRPSAREARTALDIASKIRREHMEEGLLGLAFHPKVMENGFVYLHYSASDPRRNVVSRYQMDARRETIDPDSETVVLEVEQPYGNHNGGMLAFGPDGFLYIAFGDGGSAGDPKDFAQNKSVLLGKILRIDVDKSEGGRRYAIPKDNPFLNEKGARGEIWAWGLRNPWRFSFDRVTGALWTGDVGQDAWEEIDIIKKGKNYGWNRFEGRHPFNTSRSATGPYEPPLVEHGRGEAQSITGGYVYRGKRHPELFGRYIYGDFMTGRIWTLDAAAAAKPERPIPFGKGTAIASFGEDRAGEVYFLSFDGRVYGLTD